MKRFLLLIGLASAAAGASASPQVGVSVSVHQPGVYGRIDIGRVPSPPVLMYPQPVVVVPGPVVQTAPVYMHVPPGHARRWRDHCAAYGACGRPVYFVREDWYQRHYHPHYRPYDPPRHGYHHHGHRPPPYVYQPQPRWQQPVPRGHGRHGDYHAPHVRSPQPSYHPRDFGYGSGRGGQR